MEWLQPVLVLSVRSFLGLLMGASLGLLGVGVGWASFVFFGASSGDTLLILLMGGAAVGSAGGSFLAWLNLDYNTGLKLVGKAVLFLLAAIAGAWGGFQYSSVREIPCCAKADITPITYFVLGAVVATNVVALALRLTGLGLPSLRRQLALGKTNR
ncbi:MAG: hypothetical protein J4N81_15840 [Chloroflexi bacterium]|nr:hypothetical protein [Chloroflexota bacterium]